MCKFNFNPILKKIRLCLFGIWKGGSLICINVVVIWVVRAVDYFVAKLQGRFLAHDVMDNCNLQRFVSVFCMGVGEYRVDTNDHF
jgi:hypothetical protein